MWLLSVTCSADDWRTHAVTFKAIAEKYQNTCISSKKTPDGTRYMQYKLDDVDDAEAFQQECIDLGFKAYFESF